jgi:hypothetical protein
MTGLLGVGAVILEQAQAPELAGGGDVLVEVLATGGPYAELTLAGTLASMKEVEVASPRAEELVLVRAGDREPVQVVARGGVPSLERALGDPETAGQPGWVDGPEDQAWLHPDPESIFRAADRFHPFPEQSRWQGSWAEWLYFNGSSGDTRFYLTFLVGEGDPGGLRPAGVRLQLENTEFKGSWWAEDRLDGDQVLESAPELEIAGCSIRLSGNRYLITLDLPAPGGEGLASEHLRGELSIEGDLKDVVPPFRLYGASDWVSGYVVPVPDGRLGGFLEAGDTRWSLAGGTGYHDHNWGYWEGVTWRWGQVSGRYGSFLYGRVIPPEQAADPDKVPSVLVFRGVDGSRRFLQDVEIRESGGGAGEAPQTIVVRGSGPGTRVRMEFQVAGVERTGFSFGGDEPGMDLLQMRGTWVVEATLDGVTRIMEASGSAETFRGAPVDPGV